MMDTTAFSEGQFVTPELIKSSPSKVGVIISEALPEKSDYGDQLCCQVDVDGRTKKWRMNRDSVKAMQRLGFDSKNWVGRKVQFVVIAVQGKDRIIGTPITE